MKAIVERHGGTVEKFIGDAVMAVFGVPVAARGRRPAGRARGGRDAGGCLRRELGIRRGPDRRQHRRGRDGDGRAARDRRRGQHRGAVGAGGAAGRDPDRRGDAAARAVAVEVERERPLELKGKSEPVSAWRLLRSGGRPAATGRTRDGRPRARADAPPCRLRPGSSRPDLPALHGARRRPGSGSRASPRSSSAASTRAVLRGRCLSYGEGITYWPVVEILKQLGPCRRLTGIATARVRCSARRNSRRRRRDRLGASASCWRRPRASGRSCVCSTTCTGPRRRCSTWSSTSPTLPATRRSSSVHRAPRSPRAAAAWGGGKWNATTVLLEPLDASRPTCCSSSWAASAGSCATGSSSRRRATRSSWRRCSHSFATSPGRAGRGAADDPGAARCAARPA